MIGSYLLYTYTVPTIAECLSEAAKKETVWLTT